MHARVRVSSCVHAWVGVCMCVCACVFACMWVLRALELEFVRVCVPMHECYTAAMQMVSITWQDNRKITPILVCQPGCRRLDSRRDFLASLALCNWCVKQTLWLGQPFVTTFATGQTIRSARCIISIWWFMNFEAWNVTGLWNATNIQC